MTSQGSFRTKIRVFIACAQFVSLLFVQIALAAPAQLADSSQSSGKPSAGSTAQGIPVRHSQTKRADSASDSVSFLPAVTYIAGGDWPDYSEWSLAVADVNGDGKPDLVAINFNGAGNIWDATHGGFGVLLGNGDGTFQPVRMTYLSQGTSYLAIGDVNGDGKPDLVIASCCESNNDGEVAVLLGNGDGTFQAPVSYDAGGGAGGVGQPLALTDLNGDGKLDIVAVNWGGSIGVLIGNGDGTFQPAVVYQTGVNASALALADVNGDGKTDALVQSFGSTTIALLLGNGNGTFQSATISNIGTCGGASLAAADVNGDGVPDVVVAGSDQHCGTEGFVGVALGNGNGTFQSMVYYSAGGYSPNSADIADVNGDGAPDILVANVCGITNCFDQNAGTVGVLLGNGDGTFQPPTVFPSGGSSGASLGTLAVADLNGGAPDIIVTNIIQNTVAVLLNNTESGVPTATTLVSSLNPSVVGQSVTFTATVGSSSGTPPNGETITFKNGSAVLGTAALTSGIASLTTSSLPAGTYTITASYGGDANLAASTSPGLRQVVNSTKKSTTATILISSLNPSIYGQSVTWTATVTAAGSTPPTGKVNFTWDIYTIGSATLNSSGVATLTKSNLNADSYPLTAVYKGDANNLSSTSPVVNQVVTEAASSATLTSSPNPSTSGEAVTFTATITSPTVKPTGPVTFAQGKTVLGTTQLSGGKAKFTTSTLPVGSNVVTATYYGDSNISQSSASVTQTVTGGVIPPVFTMPYNGTLYLLQEGGSAGADTEFGIGTSSTNFVQYYSGLPNNPNPVGEVMVGYFSAGTVINFAMFSQLVGQSGWAFSTGTDQASIVAFTDTDNSLGMGGSITQQTSSTTWLLHLDDALSYLYDDDDNDVLMQIRVAPSSPHWGGTKMRR